MLFEVNFLAVIAATILGFLFGWGWYAFFGKVWAKEAGVNMEEACKDKKHSRKVYGSALLLSFVAALAFAAFLGDAATVSYGVSMGFVIGAFWVSTSLGVNYLFANRSLKLLLIDSGYHIAQFVIYGMVLGFWH